MTLISNICILILIVFFIVIASVKIIYFTIETNKIKPNTAASLTIVLFLLLSGAILPRLLKYLF